MTGTLDLPNGNLLIVDDDIQFVQSLVPLLHSFFERVFTASNGDEALSIFVHEKVDVIVSEALMSPITGIELFRIAKHSVPAMTAIMVSDKVDHAEILQAQREKIIDAFIPKPCDAKTIIAIIRYAFASSQLFFPVKSATVRS